MQKPVRPPAACYFRSRYVATKATPCLAWTYPWLIPSLVPNAECVNCLDRDRSWKLPKFARFGGQNRGAPLAGQHHGSVSIRTNLIDGDISTQSSGMARECGPYYSYVHLIVHCSCMAAASFAPFLVAHSPVFATFRANCALADPAHSGIHAHCVVTVPKRVSLITFCPAAALIDADLQAISLDAMGQRCGSSCPVSTKTIASSLSRQLPPRGRRWFNVRSSFRDA